MLFYMAREWRHPTAILSSPQLRSAGGRYRSFASSGRFWLAFADESAMHDSAYIYGVVYTSMALYELPKWMYILSVCRAVRFRF